MDKTTNEPSLQEFINENTEVSDLDKEVMGNDWKKDLEKMDMKPIERKNNDLRPLEDRIEEYLESVEYLDMIKNDNQLLEQFIGHMLRWTNKITNQFDRIDESEQTELDKIVLGLIRKINSWSIKEKSSYNQILLVSMKILCIASVLSNNNNQNILSIIPKLKSYLE